MTDYTPTTDNVRYFYSQHTDDGIMGISRRQDEFDRWLAAHESRVRFEYLRSLSEKYGKLAIDARADDMALTAIQFRTTAALLAEEALHLMKGVDDE